MSWSLFRLLSGGEYCWSRALNHSAAGQQMPAESPTNDNFVKNPSAADDIETDAYRFDGEAFPQYRITYSDDDGSVTEREIYVNRSFRRNGIVFYRSWCFLDDEFRTFRSDRVLHTINLQTGRRIQDILAHWLRE